MSCNCEKDHAVFEDRAKWLLYLKKESIIRVQQWIKCGILCMVFLLLTGCFAYLLKEYQNGPCIKEHEESVIFGGYNE